MKLQKRIKFLKRLKAYKQRKTLGKRPTTGDVFKNNSLPFFSILEPQNRLIILEVDKINIRLEDMRLTDM